MQRDDNRDPRVITYHSKAFASTGNTVESQFDDDRNSGPQLEGLYEPTSFRSCDSNITRLFATVFYISVSKDVRKVHSTRSKQAHAQVGTTPVAQATRSNRVRAVHDGAVNTLPESAHVPPPPQVFIVEMLTMAHVKCVLRTPQCSQWCWIPYESRTQET